MFHFCLTWSWRYPLIPSRQIQLITALFACLLPNLASAQDQASPSPAGIRPELQANILIVTNYNAVEHWKSSTAAARSGDAGRLRKMTPGHRTFAPIVVTGDSAESTPLSADFEFVTPEGKVILAAKQCCSSVGADTRTPGVMVLNPVPEITLKASHPPGTYTLRATVTDGSRIWIASETVALETRSGTTAAPAPTTVQTYSPGDPRNCLKYSDDKTISNCAEKYR